MYASPMDSPTTFSFPQGTLETLVLRSLELGGEQHGYGIARHIERESGEKFRVEEGSLYPALRRLEKRGDVEADWRESDTGRKARYYALTRSGRKRLVEAKSSWSAMAGVMNTVLGVGSVPRRGTA